MRLKSRNLQKAYPRLILNVHTKQLPTSWKSDKGDRALFLDHNGENPLNFLSELTKEINFRIFYTTSDCLSIILKRNNFFDFTSSAPPLSSLGVIEFWLLG